MPGSVASSDGHRERKRARSRSPDRSSSRRDDRDRRSDRRDDGHRSSRRYDDDDRDRRSSRHSYRDDYDYDRRSSRYDDRDRHSSRRDDRDERNRESRRRSPSPRRSRSPRRRDERDTASPRSVGPSTSNGHRADDAAVTARPSEPAGETPEQAKLREKREKLAAWKAKREAAAAATGDSPVGSPAASPATPPARATMKPIASSSAPPPVSIKGASARLGLPIKSSLPARAAANAAAATLGGRASTSMMDDDSAADAAAGRQRAAMFRPDAAPLEEAEPATVADDSDDDELGRDDETGLVRSAKPEPSGDVEMAEATPAVEEAKPATTAPMAVDEEDEEDPLDAYMSGVVAEVRKVNRMGATPASAAPSRGVVMLGDEDELAAPLDGDDDEEEKPDEILATSLRPEDILALAAKKVKKKDLVAPDHEQIEYEPFRRAFYHAPAEIADMTAEEAELLRLELDGIKIRGVDCPKPITKWSYAGLPAAVLDVIRNLNYTAPTSIQTQAIPAIMSGRDVIGVAKTGSGKTVAFLLPMFRHIKDQRPLAALEGPIGLILTPTRELATQIHRDCKPFVRALGIRAACLYGGSPLGENIAELKRGAELVVCTPGRMIDLLMANSGRIASMRRVTFVVLDEADRMFDMGFEPQVTKILNQVRPDRQTVLFSATFPKAMEALARKILKRPLEIVVGGRSVVASEIEQIIEVREADTKFNRLLEILGRMYFEDKDARTLVFVDRQESADNLLGDLQKRGYTCMSLHGGKDQVDRDETISDFKSGACPIVIATSVAARGLDVKQLKLVVNYDAPNHLEDYVHRAGRTGRAGNKGTCITFVEPDQDKYAVDLVRALKDSKVAVPEDLQKMSDEFLAKVKGGKATATGSGFGGKGLDRFEKDRDNKEKAQRSAYGESTAEDKKETERATAAAADEAGGGEAAAAAEAEYDYDIEIRHGPAPDSSRRGATMTRPSAGNLVSAQAVRAAEEAARKNGTVLTAVQRAQIVAQALAGSLGKVPAPQTGFDYRQETLAQARVRDPDATEYHAIVPANDFPTKVRWRITNKETTSFLIETHGCSVTLKGVYYAPGKEPTGDDPPKLHLLLESNEREKLEGAIQSVKRILVEASIAALEAENQSSRDSRGGGRYTI